MINDISWSHANNIYFMALFAVIVLIAIFRLFKVKKSANLLSKNLNNYSYTKVLIKFFLFIVGAFFLFLALLGPQWSTKNENIEQRGRDVLIALDISKSMLTEDLAPNRLSVAKEKIKKLVNLLDTDRVALLLFSGTSFIQCPLTKDLDSFLNMLDQVDVETISSGTTAIDKAILQSLNMFSVCGIESNKIMIIFTDGEDFSSNLTEVKERATKENLFIFTVGVGTENGAPIPLFDIDGNQIGHQKYKDGSIVISKLNEAMLQKLSNDSGGSYIKISKNSDDLNMILKNIKQFEEKSFGKRDMEKYESQYPYFVAVSFICLLVEWLL
ncbi:hypothetical protein A3F66_01625 [candidate division TM6 bacterium RIFCSPHIGHO2_12_FULL_32_22]|nr:MAG: hypothetical protein A3F66_01625 [candidate division TM6 bacterium RIFCSPHIGHO2_12_FULL_32_22]